MEKEQTFRRIYNDDMNDNNKVNLQSKFESKDNLELGGKTYVNPPKDQIALQPFFPISCNLRTTALVIGRTINNK